MASGYKPGWSHFRFTDRFGAKPVVVAGDLVDPARATLDEKRAYFAGLARVARAKGYKFGWAAHRFRESSTRGSGAVCPRLCEAQIRNTRRGS